jgi:hypothetical protein
MGHPHRVTHTRCRTDTAISPDDGHIVLGHPHRVTNTRCRIDTVISPDDGHSFGAFTQSQIPGVELIQLFLLMMGT